MNQLAINAFNWADYSIIAVVVFSTLISLMRGFISEAISLLTWIVAAVVAFKLAGPMGHLLSSMIHSASLRLIISFVIVLIIILIVGSIINHFLGVFIKSTGLSGTNRILGMVFGFARGILLVAILILFARTTSAVKDAWWYQSQLIPHFYGLVNWLQQFIPLHFNNMSHYFANPKRGDV